MDPYFARASYDVQQECERQFIRMAEYAHQKTGSRNICIAGGVGLNGLSNTRILEHTPFERMWIQPACSDMGIPLGLALWGYFREIAIPSTPRAWISMPTAYTGRPYPRAEIESCLQAYKIDYRPTNPEEIASFVAAGKVIGWFEGSSEFGPRALGHRSFIADPRDPGMKDRLNISVKFREGYRPYAPSILAEHASDWLKLDCPSPFMLHVVEVLPDKRDVVPAITHVDNTTRPQTVTAEASPNYHRMIKAFYELTGVPMVLNTSFNVNREPIAETPLDALICAFGSSVDYLYLEGLLVDSKRYAGPELVKAMMAERQRNSDEQWKLITERYLVNYNIAERDRYLVEENRIAEWYRDYRSKYELEQAMLRWRETQSRVLIVGTRAHTRCLYLYIPEFPQVDVQAFVPLDDLPGERGELAIYRESTLEAVPWNEIDAVLISTHEYQTQVMERVQRVAPPGKPITVMYDDSGDSLLYVLPNKWPIMNPIEAERHGLITARSKSRALAGVDLDFQPDGIKVQERYAVIINYHYCHPSEGAEFDGMRGIRPEDLDHQLRILTRNFTLTTIGELLNPAATLPETVAVLTFDDGLKDVINHALPVLERWGVPATIYCCSAPLMEGRLLDVHKTHILQGKLGLAVFQKEFERVLASLNHGQELDSPESLGIHNLYRYDDDATRNFKMLLNYRLPYPVLTRALSLLVEEAFGAEAEVATRLYLSPSEIRLCQKAGLEIGMHSHQHYILSRLTEAGQRRELETAAAYFNDTFGVDQIHLAYPYGGVGTWNPLTKQLLKRLNFKSAVTMERRIVKPADLSHRWEIPRFDVRDVFQPDNSLRPDKLGALFSSD